MLQSKVEISQSTENSNYRLVFGEQDFGKFCSQQRAKHFADILTAQCHGSKNDIAENWGKPFQTWMYTQIAEFLGLSETLKVVAPTFREHYIDGLAFIDMNLKDMEKIPGLTEAPLRQVFLNLLSFFRRLNQRPFPPHFHDANLKTATMARFRNSPQPDIPIDLNGDPMLDHTVNSQKDFKALLMKYIDNVKENAENFIFCWTTDLISNLIQEFSDKNPNQFDRMCIDFEENAANQEITDPKQRYQVQLGFVVMVLKDLFSEKSLEEIVKMSQENNHDALYSEHIVFNPENYREYFSHRDFYNFLHLLPLQGKLTVEVSHACNMFRSHEISLRLEKYNNIHRRSGHSLFMDEKSRKHNGIEMVNDYFNFINKMVEGEEGISVDPNPEVTFFYSSFFQFWDTSFSELGSVVIYNQVSGFSIIHEIPPLIGNFGFLGILLKYVQ